MGHLCQGLAWEHGFWVKICIPEKVRRKLMLAFVLHRDSVIAIPISKKKEHVLEHAKVWDITLNKEDMEIIKEEFPAPERKILLDNV